jgi:predicted DNA-binding transcriptional regulator AlpA
MQNHKGDLIDMKQCSQLTGYSLSHLYFLTRTKKISHFKPSARQILFDKCEVEQWMRRFRIEAINPGEMITLKAPCTPGKSEIFFANEFGEPYVASNEDIDRIDKMIEAAK